MRICLVSQEYPPETADGGIGYQTHAKAHGLARKGHEVHVISMSPDHQQHEYRDELVQVLRIPGCWHRLPICSPAVEWLTYSVEVAAAVAGLHSRSPLDLLEFPEYGAEGYVHLLNRTEWNLIPAVIHLHGPLVMFAHTMRWPDTHSEFYRLGTMMEGSCLRLADAIYSSSACSAEWCARHYGIARERIPVLHVGVNPQLFAPHPVPKETRPTVIFVGRIDPNKGVDLLVDAACTLAAKYPDLLLRLLGRGDAAVIDGLRSKAARAGLPELLDFPGYVSRQELPEQLCRAHVFAAPSVYEGGPGFVYLEAMACGLPVIGCDGSGVSEVVTHGKDGLLVPPRDREALVEGLDRLLSDSARRAEMGACARSRVLAEAASEACLDRIEAFYKATAARGRGQARVA
jgi:glycosyltransferase involved in cell wall biosynthesis